jgi:N-hydroxyarylamine O-acetyltransferase
MNSRDYLDRIGASRSFHPSLQTLAALHESHMAAVPFENLDIPLGREIVMDEGRFLGKIVRQQRGGFCYELNGAFAWLLREIGFDVTFLSARVFSDEGVPGPDFDHMALLVRVDGENWIADVGFGDSFRRPVRLERDDIQLDSDPRGLEHRFVEEDGTWSLWKRETRGDADHAEWACRYSFTLAPRRLDEYSAMCRHQQVSPESSFTRRIVCSRTTTEGRITLTATMLIETTMNGRVETPVPRERWHHVLRDRFGVVLPRRIDRWPDP